MAASWLLLCVIEFVLFIVVLILFVILATFRLLYTLGYKGRSKIFKPLPDFRFIIHLSSL